MACDTFRGQPNKQSGGGTLVTGLAGRSGMGALKRKPVQMLIDRIESDQPALRRVAVAAFGTKLPAVNVSVTIRTLCPYVAEDRARMTNRTVRLAV